MAMESRSSTAQASPRHEWARRLSGRGSFLAAYLARAFLLAGGTYTVCFLLFSIIPGDPARVMLGINATPEAVAVLREKLGADRPLAQQYISGLNALLVGDFGWSIAESRQVGPLVLGRLRLSGLIGGLACIMALAISYAMVAVGFLVPRMKWLPRLGRLWIALPAFLSAVLAAVVAGTWVPSLPLSGYALAQSGWWAAFAPAAIVGLYPTACMASILDGKIHSASLSAYWRAGRAFGLSWPQLFHRAGLAPALDAWAEVWFNQISLVFFTTFLVEIVFSIPGIGSLLLAAIQRKDFPLLQGIVLFNVLFFVLIRLVADLFHSRRQLLRR
jgi:peptide/nickel transport system permease protein